jgi:uncharacterized membrane protein YpjA
MAFFGHGVDFGGITSSRPEYWLASHFVGLASHFAMAVNVVLYSRGV